MVQRQPGLGQQWLQRGLGGSRLALRQCKVGPCHGAAARGFVGDGQGGLCGDRRDQRFSLRQLLLRRREVALTQVRRHRQAQRRSGQPHIAFALRPLCGGRVLRQRGGRVAQCVPCHAMCAGEVGRHRRVGLLLHQRQVLLHQRQRTPCVAHGQAGVGPAAARFDARQCLFGAAGPQAQQVGFEDAVQIDIDAVHGLQVGQHHLRPVARALRQVQRLRHQVPGSLLRLQRRRQVAAGHLQQHQIVKAQGARAGGDGRVGHAAPDAGKALVATPQAEERGAQVAADFGAQAGAFGQAQRLGQRGQGGFVAFEIAPLSADGEQRFGQFFRVGREGGARTRFDARQRGRQGQGAAFSRQAHHLVDQVTAHRDALAAFGQRAVAFAVGAVGLQQGKGQRAGQRHDGRCGDQHAAAVAHGKAAQPVGARVGLGAHRLVRGPAAQVFGEVGRRRVARVGVALQRLGQDGVQVAAQFARQRAFGAAAGLRRRRADGGAGPLQLAFGDGQFHLGRCVQARDVGPHAAQQFEEHHAQRVDVGGGGQGFAQHLLGGGVGRCHDAAGGLGEGGGGAVCRVGSRGLGRIAGVAVRRGQQLGDTEIEQPHLSVGGNEDVAGLEVAVDDQPRVRVLQRVQHLAEQRHALRGAQAAGVAPAVDGQAVNAFHRQPGRAVVGHASVVKPRDVGVAQPRQDVAFADKARHQLRARAVAQRQLQCHLARGLGVSACGPPHGGHATAAQQFTEHPGADLRAAGQAFGQQPGGARHLRTACQPVVLGARVVGFQHVAQPGGHGRLVAVQPGQPGGQFGSRQVARGVEQGRHAQPGLRGDGGRRQSRHAQPFTRQRRCKRTWAAQAMAANLPARGAPP